MRAVPQKAEGMTDRPGEEQIRRIRRNPLNPRRRQFRIPGLELHSAWQVLPAGLG